MSRSPRGGRGLKRDDRVVKSIFAVSLPSRGAWIETRTKIHADFGTGSRSPRGGRGLKRIVNFCPARAVTNSRSPRGGRGLKLNQESVYEC